MTANIADISGEIEPKLPHEVRRLVIADAKGRAFSSGRSAFPDIKLPERKITEYGDYMNYAPKPPTPQDVSVNYAAVEQPQQNAKEVGIDKETMRVTAEAVNPQQASATDRIDAIPQYPINDMEAAARQAIADSFRGQS